MEPRTARGSVKDGQTGRRALHQLALFVCGWPGAAFRTEAQQPLMDIDFINSPCAVAQGRENGICEPAEMPRRAHANAFNRKDTPAGEH